MEPIQESFKVMTRGDFRTAGDKEMNRFQNRVFKQNKMNQKKMSQLF